MNALFFLLKLLNKLIVIPTQTELYIAAGANINVMGNGGIVSYSPINFDGNEINPISFDSTDGKGQGLLVINADKKSYINYTSFNNLFADITLSFFAAVLFCGSSV